jgi:type IV pilus assembly protein PilW
MNYGVKRQAGLTLVELMVATTLSLVLLAGVLLVFSANKTTYQMQTGLGTLQENGRYAMNRITADLQMAGFGGCLSPHTGPRIIVLATSPPAYLDNLANGQFFGGVNDAAAGAVTFPREPSGNVDVSTGTDSIEIRGALVSGASYVASDIATSGAIEVQGTVSSSATTPYFLISDCAGADIFAATGFTANGSNTDVAHAATGNTQAALSRGFPKDAVVTELATHTYFIGDTGRTNSTGQAIMALYRFDGPGTRARELVDGVEDLQIEYALDTDDNGTIDAFADPGGVTNWDEVMAVRVSLLLNSVNGASGVSAPYTFFPASSTSISPPSNDLRLRQEFTALVSVRNSVL